MNIVKGVADLIRRTSSGQTGESTQGSSAERFSPPSPKICFSEVGDEAVLHMLWEKYKNAVDKVTKKKCFHVFLKQFLMVFEKWEPANASRWPEAASTTVPPVENPLRTDDIIVGCSAGHPAEIIFVLTEEITVVHSRVDLPGDSTSLSITSEGLPVLNALTIITRSLHNCRVFGYYGGIQKLTALMKGAVVQLKSITSALSGDENLSNIFLDKTRLLQQILVYVVSITCGFIDLNTNLYEKAQLFSSSAEFSAPSWGASSNDSSSSMKVPTETGLCWHQRAVVSVMEAGGLNWLVVEQLMGQGVESQSFLVGKGEDYKILWIYCYYSGMESVDGEESLSENPRGQNHFKSIGGLEVLLDGLGLPSINVLLLRNASHFGEKSQMCSPLRLNNAEAEQYKEVKGHTLWVGIVGTSIDRFFALMSEVVMIFVNFTAKAFLLLALAVFHLQNYGFKTVRSLAVLLLAVIGNGKPSDAVLPI
ncbi:unnamed protein product [Dovyalis caffra]|uniref:Uncharacterized protein n=1 Tax=Dovyalis caffra TaxID=77055 RepID=A0AAV1SAI3_9ROSI|nr:unnamed protein product [Dovyalis caffra]